MTTLKVAKVLSSTPLDDTDVCSTLTDFLASEQDKLHTHQRHGYWNDLMAVAGTMATDPAQEQALQDILDREQLQPAEEDDAAGEGVDDHLAYSAPSAGQTNVGFVQPAMKREEEDDDNEAEEDGISIPKQEEISPKEEEEPRLKEEESPKSEKRSAKKDKKAAKKAKKAKKEAKKEKKRNRASS